MKRCCTHLLKMGYGSLTTIGRLRVYAFCLDGEEAGAPSLRQLELAGSADVRVGDGGLPPQLERPKVCAGLSPAGTCLGATVGALAGHSSDRLIGYIVFFATKA